MLTQHTRSRHKFKFALKSLLHIITLVAADELKRYKFHNTASFLDAKIPTMTQDFHQDRLSETDIAVLATSVQDIELVNIRIVPG